MTVTALFRYPVDGMLGESLPRATVEDGGLLGDRAYAVLDLEAGEPVGPAAPELGPGLRAFAASYVGDPVPGAAPPQVTITFPDGSTRRSDDVDIDRALSEVLGRDVVLDVAPGAPGLLRVVGASTPDGGTADDVTDVTDAARHGANVVLDGEDEGGGATAGLRTVVGSDGEVAVGDRLL